MTTLAPQNLRDAAAEFEALYASAVFSGIVGDLAHRLSGGYHISLEDQPSNNYSCVRLDDAAPPGDWPRNLAAAIDMSMSASDMAVAAQRIIAVWQNPGDTRRRYFNCINGWTGSGDAKRWDFVTGGVGFASADHKWHVHAEIRRRYVNDPMARKALVSMMRGESYDQWLSSIGGGGMSIIDVATQVIRGDWGNGDDRKFRLAAAGYDYEMVQAEVRRLLGNPTPPPPPAPAKRDLFYGDNVDDFRPGLPMMEGQDVADVQYVLARNYRSYAGGLVNDGWYGPKTKKVVIEFQRRAGLLVDGVVGPKTRERLGL